MISNYGGMTGYTVYKTSNAGSVSMNVAEPKAPEIVPPKRVEAIQPRKDTYEPGISAPQKENRADEELKNIRKLLEVLVEKITPIGGQQNQNNRNFCVEPPGAAINNKSITPADHPLLKSDMHSIDRDYLKRNPQSRVPGNDGSYNILQSCKNLHKWAKDEYSQTEGFDTTYSPQELRDRISVLGDIQNHINSVGEPQEPSVQKYMPITEKNMTNYKNMRKSPERITRKSYFEATV